MGSPQLQTVERAKVFLGGGGTRVPSSDLRLWRVAVEVEYGAEGEPAGF